MKKTFIILFLFFISSNSSSVVFYQNYNNKNICSSEMDRSSLVFNCKEHCSKSVNDDMFLAYNLKINSNLSHDKKVLLTKLNFKNIIYPRQNSPPEKKS
tara:strand:+ start:180 stop:476 length:297 start_codon:yes stop_codon:yes gene_type:complete